MLTLLSTNHCPNQNIDTLGGPHVRYTCSRWSRRRPCNIDVLLDLSHQHAGSRSEADATLGFPALFLGPFLSNQGMIIIARPTCDTI